MVYDALKGKMEMKASCSSVKDKGKLMDQQVKEQIENSINNNDVCLFMKGSPEAPQCGFSMAVSNILKILKLNTKVLMY